MDKEKTTEWCLCRDKMKDPVSLVLTPLGALVCNLLFKVGIQDFPDPLSNELGKTTHRRTSVDSQCDLTVSRITCPCCLTYAQSESGSHLKPNK